MEEQQEKNTQQEVHGLHFLEQMNQEQIRQEMLEEDGPIAKQARRSNWLVIALAVAVVLLGIGLLLK
ncbi:MAG: hypothetical protein J5669_03440 [Bacteroidales bacterium]|nr:hypothetical protein [Bacteroidales bacterium]